MILECLQKKKSKNDLDSDHIVLVDSNNNQLEIFWCLHDVIIFAKDCNSFSFSKNGSPEIYDFLSKFSKQIKKENSGREFVKGNKFIWHNMSIAWDRPIEEEAGFIATINDDSVKVDFFPPINKFLRFNSNKNFFISMGGPDGYLEPYQSISNLFASALNELLYLTPYTEENDQKDNDIGKIL